VATRLLKIFDNLFTRFDRIHERDGQPEPRRKPHDVIGRAYA